MTSGKEGGTWLGISRFGNIGMLTNYRSKSDLKNPNNPSNLKSRGNIVSDFLINRPSPSDYINSLIHGNDLYSTFNTLIADFDWKISNFRFFYGNNVKGCVEELSEGNSFVFSLLESSFTFSRRFFLPLLLVFGQRQH